MSDGKKVLVVRFSSIGDIILTTPVYRALKQQINAEVHLITKRSFAFAIHGNPYIDKVITIENKVAEVADVLGMQNYDFVVDLHNNLRSMQVKRLVSAPSASVKKLNLRKWMLVNLKWDVMPDEPHIVYRYMEAASPLGVRYDGRGMDFAIPDDAVVDIADLTAGSLAAGQFVALAVGTSTPTRSLEKWQLIELVNKISKPVVLLGGANERATAEEVAATDETCYSLAGALSLQQSASVMMSSSVLIAPDTSLMHMGAALDHPMITVWGNTNERFGMTPFYREGSEHKWHMVEVGGLKCRPCSKIGYDKCPRGHFKCIRDLDLGHIAALANDASDKPVEGE